ncbi:unnamed protein product [Adineta ricciae]|uniref:Uncharacterized protein n=1 Tax=Adineta ricciae TaxID=249248 RepID=A0A813S825_ADIRI|nr:unnamed protein product [Adineta ricciae]CAF1492594.1 unnamed protein product [Adineta ricciae]
MNLREQIVSQCVWSETYSSLKHILKRTSNQLPLLVSFCNTDDSDETGNEDYASQSILFFDRMVSTKMLLSPLRPSEKHDNQFEIYPRHCTFATTDLYKGLFEFILNGQRCSKIFSNLQQLIEFASQRKCLTVFMSRDRTHAYYLEPNASTWLTKKYSPGAFFHGQRIHRPADAHQNMNNDYLECLDEKGFSVFLQMTHPGRYSLIATSPEQQVDQPEIYLHSTQTANIGQLIKQITLQNNDNNNCIRLVRGFVPHNFHCQHFQFVRQHTHDVLVGLTEENLVVEWNLESHAPCRYATNLNEILSKLSGTWDEQLLETYIDQARTNYRKNFQHDMQLISSRDWTGFFQYWKWTGEFSETEKQEKSIPYQSRHRFHLVASLQDLSADPQTLIGEFHKQRSQQRRASSQSLLDTQPPKSISTPLTNKRIFLSEMSKLLSTTHRHKRERMSLPNPKPATLLVTNSDRPFDNSIYDSNQQINHIRHNSRRTQ